MMLFNFLIALTIFSFVYGSGWYSGNNVNSVVTVSVGATNNEVWGAGYSNTLGGILTYSPDRSNTVPTIFRVGGINLDVAVAKDGSKVCVAGPSGVYYGSATASFSGTKVTGQWDSLITQTVQPFGESGFAVIGRFEKSEIATNGVAVASTPGGIWSFYDIGVDPGAGFYARYGSFPSTATWYVTSGDWPNQNDHKLSNGIVERLSPRISVYYNIGDGSPQVTFISARHLIGPYPGAISKTTDGGHTWTTVYDSNGDHAMNQIDCYDDAHCIAVGENGKKAVALKTENGGATWTVMMTLTGPKSLHAVKMISNTEFWMSGGEPSAGAYVSKEIVGNYWHSTNSGSSWSKTAYNGYGYDLSFKGGKGYAAALFKKHTDVWYYA
jgi:hypothetical protein